MKRPCFIIDAFASAPFTGNAAAVVLDAGGLSDDQMRRIAAEFNLSETTFVLPATSSHGGAETTHAVRFRWFTPTVEVDMCGHATIAGIHALFESGRLHAADTGQTIRIETRSGMLTGAIENMPGDSGQHMIWLEMIPPALTRRQIPVPEYAEALRISADVFDTEFPSVETQDRDIIVFVRDFMRLNEIRPDFRRLAGLLTDAGARGLCVSTVRTVTPSIQAQSRFFAPHIGVDEDPVTGSVHAPLAAYLANLGVVPFHDGVAGLQCTQGIPGGRTGQVYALVEEPIGGRCTTRIGGQAVTTIRGQLMT